MKHLFVLLFLLPLMNSFGQKDPDAEVYLDKIAKDMNPGQALKFEFEYTREDQQSGSEISGNGKLFLEGEKYKIDLGEVMVLFDGEKQYSIQTQVEEVYISKPDPLNKEFMFTDPIRMLRTYKEDFKYRFLGEVIFKTMTVYEIQLYPEELGGPVALLKIFVSIDKTELKGIIIRHKEGILYTMLVKDYEKINDPGTDFFRFKPDNYPDYDVIELMN